MKIATITSSNVSGLKVFKPIQYLYVVGYSKEELAKAKLRARLVNSETGRVDEIIPLLGLDVLGEITSMNEGFFVRDKANDGVGYGEKFCVNVMLHPTSAVYLSNDKYLEIDIEGLVYAPQMGETAIYGIESPVIDKEFMCRYNKFYMASGELQKTFSVGENENLILPRSNFEEVCLQYKNGSSCTYTLAELEAMMMLKNDVVSVPTCGLTRVQIDNESGTFDNLTINFGYASLFGLDVAEVDNFTIRRTYGNSAFELVMMDTIKE